MVNKIRNLVISQALVFFVVLPTILYANEPPEKILEKYNASVTGEEAMQYLTGSGKAQLASLDAKTLEKVLKHNQMKSYQTQIVPIDDNLQFISVSNIELVDGKKLQSSMLYEFVKVDDQWKIQNSENDIILDLFKQKFSPDQFHAQNFFEVDGKKIKMESAFAYSEKRNHDKEINIKFYPFPFQERDIEFLKRNSGPVVNDKDKPTAIASSIKYPTSTLLIDLDDKNQVTSFCLNYHAFEGDNVTYALCLPPNSFSMEKFIVTQNDLSVVTKGNSQTHDGKKLIWDININLPLFKEGIN